MLVELEEYLLKVLQAALNEIPPENITLKAAPSKLPAIVIQNLKFKFKNAGLAENIEHDKTQLEEHFSGNATSRVFKLKETPLRKSLIIECPPRTILIEGSNFTVDYSTASVVFVAAPTKGKDNVFVRYTSRKTLMTMKALKVKALYAIEVSTKDRAEADSLAEKIIKAFLLSEEELLSNGIEIRAMGGETSMDDGKVFKLQLKYLAEKEIRAEQVGEPMERIEIRRKNV